MTAAAWASLVDVASAPYRRAGRFAWHFARGKLNLDPVFRHDPLYKGGLQGLTTGISFRVFGLGLWLWAQLLSRAVQP